MKPTLWNKDWIHSLIGALLGAGFVALLLSSVKHLGYARDEGFYFGAASTYESWFVELWDNSKVALTQASIDRHWAVNSEHPGFVKSLFALSHHFLFVKWKLFAEEGTSFRFPGMVFGGVIVMITYVWGPPHLRRPGWIRRRRAGTPRCSRSR